MAKSDYKKGDIVVLIRHAQNGEIKALEELIKRVQKQVYAIFAHLVKRKEDISDLTQETLLKMAKSIYQLKEPKSFKYWLNRIIANVYQDFIRKKPEAFIEINDSEFNEIKDKLGCEPGERCIFTEIDKLVRAALMTLPKDLRLTIVLREYEGMSYQDIAELTNTALGTVKSRISRARLKLQEELKDFI